MRIGITGHRGFIGSHLKERIDNPVLFDDDLLNLSYVKKLVEQCDVIYHAAGANRSMHDGTIMGNNIASTGNLVLATKLLNKHPQIIFLSSTQTEWNADSEYGLTKRIEEKIVEMANNWCIYRVPNVYGPGCKPFYNSVVATFAYQIANGKEVTMKNPKETREFIYIDDLLDLLLKPEANEYVRPVGEIMSIKDIYDYMTARLGEHKNIQKCLEYYKGQRNGI